MRADTTQHVGQVGQVVNRRVLHMVPRLIRRWTRSCTRLFRRDAMATVGMPTSEPIPAGASVASVPAKRRRHR